MTKAQYDAMADAARDLASLTAIVRDMVQVLYDTNGGADELLDGALDTLWDALGDPEGLLEGLAELEQVAPQPGLSGNATLDC